MDQAAIRDAPAAASLKIAVPASKHVAVSMRQPFYALTPFLRPKGEKNGGRSNTQNAKSV